MTEYVDRGLILNSPYKFYAPGDGVAKNDGFNPHDWAIHLDTIMAFPSADVVPVRNGAWRFDDFDGDGLDYQCSLCRRYQRKASNYCPDCGAKMDGEMVVKCLMSEQ